MAGETSTTPLSKDPFASEQLLRAAEQLQDAIKSVRRRRSSHITHSASMVTSPHTTHTRSRSERSATFEDDAFDNSINSEQSDKENVQRNGSRSSSDDVGVVADKAFAARCDASLKQQWSRDRFSRQMTQSMSGEMLLDLASLSECSDEDSDEGNGERVRQSSRYSVSEWERRGILRMSKLSLSGMSQSDLEPLRSRHMTRSEMDKSIGEMTRRALDWMQQDTEKQAKENKAMQELLHGVISIINDVVADLAPSSDHQDGVGSAASATHHHIPEVQHWKEPSIDKVDKLVSEWELVLLSWRKDALDSKKEARESCELFQEDCEAKMRQLCDLQVLERGKRATHSNLIIALLLHWLIKPCLCVSAGLTKKIADLTILAEQQQMLCEDYAGGIWNAAVRSQPPMNRSNHQEEASSCSRLSNGLIDNQLSLERDTMNLTAQLKEAELCALHWQMAYEDQVTSSRQMEEQLGMLLEEATNDQLELQKQKRRMSTMIHVDALKVYQQKIALLEGQVHGTQQQVACDHEQFLYEQKKWEYEKKHLGKEVQEIQDVSVKVLKVLLIREKMLKKQERHLQKRSLGFEERQNLLMDQFNALEAITQELMQECALILVALQEQTISSRSSHPAAGQSLIPVKPLQIKKVIKRLRKVQHVLETQRSLLGKAESLLPLGAEQ